MSPSSTPFDINDLLTTVQETLTTYQMLDPDDQVLVGVSGGPDSMALLHLLSRLAPVLKIRLGVAHLNHCLRGVSADRDAELVRQAAAAMHHPCHLGRAQVIKVKEKLGLSLEEAGRRVRYAFFRKTMAACGYNKLALGHHLDDNAEQMLMALLRGAGPRGLGGIAPVRQNRIVRPLIKVRRAQIDAFVANQAITCVRDESNDDLRFLRNRIRHHLLPLLASEYNPGIKDQLNRLADVMRTEEEWIDRLVTTPYAEAVMRRGKGTLTLSADRLGQAHLALARRLVRMALEELTGTLRRITFSHIQSVQGLLADHGADKELHLPGNVCVCRTGNQLIFKLVTGHQRNAAGLSAQPTVTTETVITGPFPATVTVRELNIGLRFSLCRPNRLPNWHAVGRNQAYFDINRLALPLILRIALPGDRFTPLGASGSQKLKKFFIDHFVPRQTRNRFPVLADQHRIVWLVGQRIDEHVKVTAATTQVLGVEFFLLDTR